MKAHRRLYAWEDGKLVEITSTDDPRYNQTRPGKKFGMFVPRTLPVGRGQTVTLRPGKRERKRLGI